MYNPRFPHRLRVWRSRLNDLDLPETNDEGDPIKDIVPIHKVCMMDGMPVIASDGAFETEEAEWIEFGYRAASKSTRDTADVHVSDYKISLPAFVTFLMPGDALEIVDYDRTYWGEVVKKQTFNLGSNIWFNEVKN